MSDRELQEQAVVSARNFAAAELRPFVRLFEENEALPRSVIGKMAGLGFLAAPFPKEYGGLGLDPVHYGLLTEEIGKASTSARALLTVHTSLVGETILRWGTPRQKAIWIPRMAAGESIGAFCLTEPNVGTDARSVQTSYRRQGSGFVISGRKKWITFGDIADFFMVVCSGEGKVTAFLVERFRPGVRTTPIKGLLAARSDHIAEVEFDNVEVPEENILGKEGSGFAYIVNTALDHGRYSIAWAGIAIAQEALDNMAGYSRTRSQFGKKIHNFQFIQGMIADAYTKIHAGRALCLRAGEFRRDRSDQAIQETTVAKYFTSRMAMEVTTDAVQVHGGNGCWNRFPVERLFREAKVLEIIEGTSQVLQEIISGFALRQHRAGTIDKAPVADEFKESKQVEKHAQIQG